MDKNESTPQPQFKVGQVVMMTSIKKVQPFIIRYIDNCDGSFFYAWNRHNYAAESMVRELTAEEVGVRSVAGGEPDWHAFYTDSQIKLYAAQEKLERFGRGEPEQPEELGDPLWPHYQEYMSMVPPKGEPRLTYSGWLRRLSERLRREKNTPASSVPAPPQEKEQK